jgi:ribosomal protein S18
MDVASLRHWTSDDSEILPRKLTGLCAKCQRKVAKTVKRSRDFGLFPHLGEFLIQDGHPAHRKEIFHESVRRVKVSPQARRGGMGYDEPVFVESKSIIR